MKSISHIKNLWVGVKITILSTYYSAWILIYCLIFKAKKRKWVDKKIRRWAKALLNAVKANYRVHNPHHVDLSQYQQSCILMSNHNSHYDIPLILVSLPGSIRMLAKIELFKVPLFGKALQKAEFPFIERGKSRQAIVALNKAQQLIKSGIITWIAPEGTRALSGQLGPIKKGGFVIAIKSRAIIIPIGIRGSEKILPPKTFRFQLNQTADLHIGKPINAANYNLKTIAQLQSVVAHQLRVLKGELPEPG